MSVSSTAQAAPLTPEQVRGVHEGECGWGVGGTFAYSNSSVMNTLYGSSL